jgi:hypothetical protein
MPPNTRRPTFAMARWTLAAFAALGLFAAGHAQGEPPPLPDDVARVHYQRPDGDYAGWELHVWEDTVEQVTWQNGLPVTGTSDYGAYWDVRLAEGAARVGFIVHRGDLKDPGPDMFLRLDTHGREIWLVSGSDRILTSRPLGPPEAGHRPPALPPARRRLRRLDAARLGGHDRRGHLGRRLTPAGTTADGVFWTIRLSDPAPAGSASSSTGATRRTRGPTCSSFSTTLAHDGGGVEAWVVSGSADRVRRAPRPARRGRRRPQRAAGPLGGPRPDPVGRRAAAAGRRLRLHHAERADLAIVDGAWAAAARSA